METEPTRRFTRRVADYVRYRPGYPAEIITLLQRECGLSADSVVADIGSGTGLLSRVFLDAGCRVFAVEPNAEMRAAADQALSANPRYRSVDARAEATTLADRSVDVVTAGQAFHWFSPHPTRVEFRRILKPQGRVVLIWNERTHDAGFMQDYDALVRRYATEREPITPGQLDDFFGAGRWQIRRLRNQQIFDLTSLQGRLNSSSYAPLPESPEHQSMMQDLTALFDTYQSNGQIVFTYRTDVIVGSL